MYEAPQGRVLLQSNIFHLTANFLSSKAFLNHFDASPQERHKAPKDINGRKEKEKQSLTCGPGKPIFPGGPSEACNDNDG